MILTAAGLGAGIVIGWAVLSFLGVIGGSAGRGISHALGSDRPEWTPGIWQCAQCRSTNVAAATRCAKCRHPRDELEHEPEPERPDWIPDRIVVTAGGITTLIHDPAAHGDPGAAHWRVTVAGRTVGSTARRDGALALLRAIEGTDTIALDVRGTGTSLFRLSDAIARFEARPFPLDVPCPERGT
jgi:hypothetical protein